MLVCHFIPKGDCLWMTDRHLSIPRVLIQEHTLGWIYPVQRKYSRNLTLLLFFFGDTKGDGLSFISYLSHMVTEAIKISSNLEPKYLAHYTHSFRLGVQVSLFMGFITTGLGVFCLCFLKGGRSKFSEWPVVIGACSHDDNNQVSYLPQKTGTHAGLWVHDCNLVIKGIQKKQMWCF